MTVMSMRLLLVLAVLWASANALADEAEVDFHIEAQDLGKGVRGYWGAGIGEYEWTITIRGSDVPALLQALDTKADVLAALEKRFKGKKSSNELQPFLDQHNIPYGFWFWMGD